MTLNIQTVLVVGSTGSIGQHVVAQAVEAGYETRALVRDASRTGAFPEAATIVVGDLTDAESLHEAVEGVDAVVFTHGSHGGAAAADAVDYGAVRNILSVLTRPARIALMTTIGVTKRTTGHDAKRRGERLVRASGLPYTIVRPGWFDYNAPDEHRIVMLQGDTRWASDPSDGVIARAQIAQVLVASLSSEAADRKTLELVAERGEAQTRLDTLFAALDADPADALDAVRDRDNLPLDEEPANVVSELERLREAR